MNDEMVRDLTPALLEKRPNTYTFTKSLAESVLFNSGKDLPIAVFRPSIVGASLREPMPVITFFWKNITTRGNIAPNIVVKITFSKCEH